MKTESSLLRLPRWVALVAPFLILAAGLVIASGPLTAVVLVGDLTDGLVLATWITAAFGFATLFPILNTRAAEEAVDPLLIFISRIAIGVGFIGLVVLGLGLAGLLSRTTSLLLLVAGVALLVWRHRNINRLGIFEWFKARTSSTLGWILLAIPAVVMLIGTSLFPALLWKPLDPHPYDVMSYHLQIPREWFDAGRIVQLHDNAFCYFPMGVEMHDLLAMHLLGGPWAAMYLCQMFSAAFVLLTALAVVGAVRQFGSGGAVAWMAGLMTACIPWSLMLGSVCYVEPGLMLYSLLAVVWAAIALKQRGWQPMAIAGAAAGLACGTKYTAVPMTVVPLLIFWTVIAWQTHGRQLFKPLLVFSLTCCVSFSPWLIRNVVWTGNPVFPLMTSVFGRAAFTQDQVDRYEAAHQPPTAEQGIAARLSAGINRVLLDPQSGYVFPWLTGMAVILLTIRRQGGLLIAQLLAMTAIWLLATHDMPRFLAPAIPFAAVLLGLAIPRYWIAQTVACVLFAGQATFGLVWTWQTLSPKLELGQQGFFRLADPTALVPSELEPALRTNGPIALIGDAQAFFQPFPSSRLLYRGVFDVNIPPGVSVIDGWLEKPVDQLRREGYWVIINSDELIRLSKTYAHLPLPPPPYDQPGQPPVVLPPTGNLQPSP